MGILRKGLLGPVKNKTGAVIGRQHRGQNVLTGLQNPSTKPPTEKQLEERRKFGMLNSFLSDIDKLVNVGFKHYAKIKTPVNVAYSYNVDHAFVKQGEEWQLNFPEMVYSRGHVDTPEGATVAPDADVHTVLFSWLAQKQTASCQFADQASFLMYNASKNKALILINATNRYALSYPLTLPAEFFGDTLHCYMNFNSADGKQSGDSMYLGELIF
ncbi:DUF6266 family protein [Pedobacter frigoris]|uniref:Uncharacterized protein n=1 Tax=Pedobacter frigoris TaxID=2571272 RepID=A0A4U1CNT8_9SPHI|nr:DUF6266 family protein [Pedobacter frigoris]TKC09621.1 hypothetical protein FA047_05930 [Pedobacter frigoris]